MADDWKLTLRVEATGHDDHHVSMRGLPGDREPYVVVRVGSVIAHCLGPAAVGSAAQAWAAAQERVNALPLHRLSRPAGGKPAPRRPEGLAVPCGSVVFDGPQRWSVSTFPGAGVLVTVGCLQVQVLDRTALDTQVLAWAKATDLAARSFPTRTVPFSRLVSNARYNEFDHGVGVWQAPPDNRSRRSGRDADR